VIPLLRAFLATVTLPLALSAQQTPARLLARAIEAHGGAARLRGAAALAWHGKAGVHLPGQDIALLGEWRIQPPDSAIVATWEAEKGPGSTRRLILAGERGWAQRDGAMNPLPPKLLEQERHQFYLYSLMRLVPLLDSQVRLSDVPADSLGRAGMLVQRPGRPDATLYFGTDGRLARVSTLLAAPQGSPAIREEITLEGVAEAEGVRWFRRLTLTQDGKPFFDLEVTDLTVLHRLEDPLLAGPP
jgi:hypothetical protein